MSSREIEPTPHHGYAWSDSRRGDRRAALLQRWPGCAGCGDNSDHYDHLKNWIDAIRTRQPVVEDPVFGFRPAGAALLSNVSYDSGKPARWDPDAMKLL